MAFSPEELAHIDATVGALVRRRQSPPELLAKVRLEMEIDGHKVRIATVRPSWSDPAVETRHPVAQFTYNRTKDRWTLHWMRRDMKWHTWPPAERVPDLEGLVRIVDADERGGFWG